MLAVRAPDVAPQAPADDEPSLGLAPLVVEEIFRTIAELHRDGPPSCWWSRTAHGLKVAQHFYLIDRPLDVQRRSRLARRDELIRRAYLGSARA